MRVSGVEDKIQAELFVSIVPWSGCNVAHEFGLEPLDDLSVRIARRTPQLASISR